MDEQKKLNDAAFETVVKLERARAALRVTIDRFNLDSIKMTKEEMMDIACCSNELYNMLEIIDEYMFDSCKELEAVL